ncbi:MAG: antibiotic biosynthesis monooxygenase [Saprospiraceae bacterium]|nr:antibiotic biosynthesis monooxygenase [Saprospiraceae bacterium]
MFSFTAYGNKSVLPANPADNESIIVLVKYIAQSGKEEMAINAINELLKKVSKEPYLKGIVLHRNPLDKSNILLYEKWSDGAYFKGAHMKSPHLFQFITDSSTFLAGPPEISFWKTE